MSTLKLNDEKQLNDAEIYAFLKSEEIKHNMKWLSKNIHTIYNYLYQKAQNTNDSFDDMDTINYSKTQINNIIKTLILNCKTLNYNTMQCKLTNSARSIHIVMDEFYSIQATKFVMLVYKYDIDNIYNHWNIFNASCSFIEQILNHDSAKALDEMLSDLNYGASTSAAFESILSMIKDTWTFGRAEISRIYCNKYMKKTNISDAYKTLICDGYVSKYGKHLNMNIPICIAQIVSIYYEPMSLYCKIKQWFANEMNKILNQRENIDEHIFESLNRMEMLFGMIKGTNFYSEYSKDIKNIFSKINKKWNDKYLCNEMGIMEYTNKIEYFADASYDIYMFDQQCLGLLIPSYIKNILNKHNGNYEDLVNKLTKIQLKQIYKLFVKVSYAEAKKLNDAYKNRKSK